MLGFKNGTAVYNLITSIPAQTITLENGAINGNSFGAIVVIDDGVTKGRGIIKGHFYGPNADEIAINIFLGDVNDNADDYFHLMQVVLGSKNSARDLNETWQGFWFSSCNLI